MSTDVPPLEDVKMGLQSLGLVPAASTATTARLRLLTASRMKPLHQVQAAQAMAAKPHAQRNSIAREVAHYCSVPIATTRLDPRTRTRTVFKLPDAEVAKNYVVAAWRLLNQERVRAECRCWTAVSRHKLMPPTANPVRTVTAIDRNS